jgi:hypothetical protein
MPELGKKHDCAECGTKFYDLGKADAVCPKCGTSPRETEKRSPAVEVRARYVAPPVAPPEEVEEDVAAPEDIAEDDEEILPVEGDEEEEEDDDEDEG